MEFITDDVIPVFVGDGRGARGLSSCLYRAYGLQSRIFALSSSKGERFRHGSVVVAGRSVVSTALRELAALYDGDKTLLLFPGSLEGARLMAEEESSYKDTYLAGARIAPFREGLMPFAPKGRLVTGYVPLHGKGVTFSHPGYAVTLVTGGLLPKRVESCAWGQITEGDVLRCVRGRYGDAFYGFFTCYEGEEGLCAHPYLAEGGLLLSRTGLSAARIALEDLLFCRETGGEGIHAYLRDGEDTPSVPSPFSRQIKGKRA